MKKEFRNMSWQSWRRHDTLDTLAKIMCLVTEKYIKQTYPKSGMYITPDEHEEHHV